MTSGETPQDNSAVIHDDRSAHLTDHLRIRLQQKLASRVTLRWDNRPVQIVGGVDVHPLADSAVAVLVLLTFPHLEHVGITTTHGPIPGPYRPGFLSFREAPLVLRVLSQCATLPDILFCDGHGIAHPRRLGLASHIGVVMGMPTIGCAKSLLFGKASVLAPTRGATAPLKTESGEQLGTALRTRSHTSPVYVSPGHLIDVRTATRFTLRCASGFRIPEPLRLAHIEAKRVGKTLPESNRAGSASP